MTVAEVNIWGKLAGAVVWDESTGYATFEYDPKFKQQGVKLAPLKMSIDANRSQFSFPERRRDKNGRAHFMSKRFDREGHETKHHIQTFCALKHFDYNLINSFGYEQLFQAMRELKLTYQDAEQMFKRMVFNVIARNCDDHTKNFAFRLKQDGKWELAPAYDLCHAYRPGSEWVSQHALSIIVNVNQWAKFANEVGVQPKLRNEIDKTLLNLR